MNTVSTGALSKEQHQFQNTRYQENHTYDYVIIGTGVAALTVGSLLVHAGYRICMLEAHDIPGGYAHTFAMNDFQFCAQVHYIWGCAPGQRIYEFLKKLGLEKEITFNAYDTTGYDRVRMPDGKMVSIPCGYNQLIENIEKAYPGQRKNLEKFVSIITTIEEEMKNLPQEPMKFWDTLLHGYKFRHLIPWRHKTLQDLFDHCNLSKEAQAILSADLGDFMSPPEELSIFPYVGLFAGYNSGAYYPKKHYKFYIDTLAQFIQNAEGCHIYYETEMVSFQKNGNVISSVTCKDGKVFTAKNFICNMDPQKASHMLGLNSFSKEQIKDLSFEYTPSAFNIYLGLKDINLRDYGFGNYNIWDVGQIDMRTMWKEMLEGNWQRPLVFLSTPTLHSSYPGAAPEGCSILELTTVANYKTFKDALNESPAAYRKLKRDLARQLIDDVEKKYIPGLKKHICLKVVGTPTTSEHYCFAPFGNAYGSKMSPENIYPSRLKEKTPFDNLFWCNASSGFPGVFGATFAGTELYITLTKDRFFKSEGMPTTQEAIEYATSCL
jgi:all-trans-retinol 13,14-reductase